MTVFLILAGILAFQYGVAAVITKLYRNALIKRGSRSANSVVKLPFGIGSILIGVVMFILGLCIVQVDGQHVGVVYTPKGVSQTAIQPGWDLIAPWNDVFMMDKTVWVYTFTNKKTEGQVDGDDAIWAPTSEGIKMGFDLSVSWRIDPAYAPWIYQNVSEADDGPEGRYKWIETNIIRAKTKSVFALNVSKYSPIQCYSTGRSEIQSIVEKALSDELSKLHLILDQVDIREVFYDPGYEAELKNKKIQEQKALTEKEITKQLAEQEVQAEKRKNISITEAQAEAEALKIKGSSIASNPKIIDLELINKWNGILPSTLINSGGQGQSILLNIAK